MAEKKFSGPIGGADPAALAADFETAARFEKLAVGKLAVYYREGFRTRAIPYGKMERAFIRVQEVRGRMCCGQATFAYFRMVFLVDGKEIAEYISENEKAMDQALAKIHELAPDVPIGVAEKE